MSRAAVVAVACGAFVAGFWANATVNKGLVAAVQREAREVCEQTMAEQDLAARSVEGQRTWGAEERP